MTTYELSFTPTFYNETLDLPRQVARQISAKLRILQHDPGSAQGDAKKLKGYQNIYRVRVGSYRIFYSFGQGWVKLLSVRKRDERAYEDDLPLVSAPETPPDPALADIEDLDSAPRDQATREGPEAYLIPQSLAQGASSTGDDRNPEPGTRNPASAASQTSLPVALSAELLGRWRIPERYWPELLAVPHAEALLDLAMPGELLSRLLDNLYPRPIAEIAVQPEYVLGDPDDIERFAKGDLSAFLLKLTPEQQALVAQERSGPTLVKGGPGTGKSTLAIYRVQRLLEQGVAPILFTTYTNALVAYSEQLLTYLLGAAPADRGVKVSTVDKLAYHYYARAHGSPRFATEGQALDLLDEAMRSAAIPAANVFDRSVRQQSLERLGRDYLLQELLLVIEAWGLASQEEYLAVERRGRATPLKPGLREALWAVAVRWRDLMAQAGLVLNEQVRRGALAAVQDLPAKPFQALIIDEAQDLSPVALRFLLALVESPRQVYLTADALQSLYQRGFSWKQVHADLNVTGRTILLKQNYRNTAQIAVACATVLAGSSAGDGEALEQDLSPHQGDPPTILLSDDPAQELQAIRAFFVESARRYRLPVHSGAVLCMSQRQGRAIAQQLSDQGVPASFQSGRDIDITAQQVKVLTLHAAKGLEFPFVAIVGLTEGQLPWINPATPADEAVAALDEQRRLFFVGCSRAMRALLVCGSRAAPSPFLQTLEPPFWQRKEIP